MISLIFSCVGKEKGCAKRIRAVSNNELNAILINKGDHSGCDDKESAVLMKAFLLRQDKDKKVNKAEGGGGNAKAADSVTVPDSVRDHGGK